MMIGVISSFVIDVSGFVDNIKYKLWKWLRKGEYVEYSLKPFDCSLCTTFWISLIYLIFIKELTVFNLMYVCIISFNADLFGDIMITVKDVCIKIIRKLNIFI